MRPAFRAALVAALVACGPMGQQHGPHGVVRGVVVHEQGRDPRSGSSVAVGTAVPVNGDVVRARDHRGHEVARAVTGHGGRFEFVMAPGVYGITEDICGITSQVTVENRRTVSVTVVIPNAC